MDTDENDEFEFETDGIEEVEEQPETDEPEVNSTAAFIDMVIDGKSTDAKDALKGMLYDRIGDRIEAMKAGMRSKAWEDDTDIPEMDADVEELSAEETPIEEV